MSVLDPLFLLSSPNKQTMFVTRDKDVLVHVHLLVGLLLVGKQHFPVRAQKWMLADKQGEYASAATETL
jgi:hypothetical protein